MRIALLHPTYAPEVLRGSERIVQGVGASLAERGHEVTLITGHPGRRAVAREDGMRIVRGRRLSQPPLLGLHEEQLGNVPNAVSAVLRGRYDLAHAFHNADAWAAVQARRLGGPPVVYSFHGIPTREFLVTRRFRLEMMRAIVAGSVASTVLSEAAARPFERYLQRRPEVLHPGVFGERFASEAPRAEVPTLLCAASLGDPRKRGELLAEAFRRLRRHRPDARLLVLRGRDPFMSPLRVELPEGAEWLEPAWAPEDLAARYASAWASVLPSVDEAFGVVLTESLAAGTPVVAARSGAGPEIVKGEGFGRLFEPDDPDDLARAMNEALELGAGNGTAAACRARAADFDWSRLGARYEELYESVA